MNIPNWALELVKDIALPFVLEVFEDLNLNQKKEEISKVVDPIYAEFLVAARGEGLLGFVLAGILPKDQDLVIKLWKLRRPYDARITHALSELGIYPIGSIQ